jgi:hypothetical protein
MVNSRIVVIIWVISTFFQLIISHSRLHLDTLNWHNNMRGNLCKLYTPCDIPHIHLRCHFYCSFFYSWSFLTVDRILTHWTGTITCKGTCANFILLAISHVSISGVISTFLQLTVSYSRLHLDTLNQHPALLPSSSPRFSDSWHPILIASSPKSVAMQGLSWQWMQLMTPKMMKYCGTQT